MAGEGCAAVQVVVICIPGVGQAIIISTHGRKPSLLEQRRLRLEELNYDKKVAGIIDLKSYNEVELHQKLFPIRVAHYE